MPIYYHDLHDIVVLKLFKISIFMRTVQYLPWVIGIVGVSVLLIKRKQVKGLPLAFYSLYYDCSEYTTFIDADDCDLRRFSG